MRIAIDITASRINQAGTSVYINNLIGSMQKLPVGHELCLLEVGHSRDMSQPKTLKARLNTLYRDVIWTHSKLPVLVKKMNCDLLHMPANIIPIIPPHHTIVTIHDTIVIQLPKKFTLWHRNYTHIMMAIAARRAKRIITVSQQSKNDIIKYLNTMPEKVQVIYIAASPIFQPIPSEQIAEVQRKYNLDQFILTVGSIEPRKNLTRLITAFAQLRAHGYPGLLVHVGPKGWLCEDIENLVSQLQLKPYVRFLGYAPIQDLVALYNAAHMFVYPSLYEGFGLPVLEAMACGCPVITSNISSLPEIAGDAALLVDPYNIELLCESMYRVWQDSTLTHNLIQKGFQRASQFSWERCARETLSVYEQVAKM